MQNYIQQLDAPVATEEPLSFEQIVSVVNTENEGDSDESEEEEIPCVQIKEARLGLETAIRYFEQSDSADVDFNDLRIFRKYLNLLSLKELQSKRQQKIDFYFTK